MEFFRDEVIERCRADNLNKLRRMLDSQGRRLV